MVACNLDYRLKALETLIGTPEEVTLLLDCLIKQKGV
jgi:hypothetical protein